MVQTAPDTNVATVNTSASRSPRVTRRRRVTQGAIAATGAGLAYATPIAQRVVHGQTVGSPPPTGGNPTPTTGVSTPTVGPSPTPLPAQCNLPLERVLAPSGSGTAGTSQCAVTGGFRQTIQVNLTGAPANTAYDVYIDQESEGTIPAHIYAGTFMTNASGNANFVGSVVVPVAAGEVDNEIVLQGASPTAHEFIQTSFVPCAC